MKYSFRGAAVMMAVMAVCGLQACSSGGRDGKKLHRISADAYYSRDSLGVVYDSTHVSKSPALSAAIASASDGDTIVLTAGLYIADPQPFVDPLCGNCTDPKTSAAASTGFVIKDKSLVIIGAGKDSTALVTRAGYGLYIENAPEVHLSDLAITGGRRDKDGNATDAAVVVRGSRVHLDRCALAGNTHRAVIEKTPPETLIVGIGGLFGREGAEIFVSHSEIINNGWDGIALYRGASAVVTDCVIKKGRGAGIGVTWDATCVALRNDISGYWKGIGAFGTSQVVAHNNLVYDNLGWGIIGTGQSFLDAANNVVYHNGNCGVAPWSPECRGRFVNNIIIDNGWREEWVCPCVGVWNYGTLANWQFFNNLVWNNKEGNYRDMADLTGRGGNISADPLFVGGGDFHLKPGSPAIDAGYGEITDHDGSPSDLGLYGGTSARRK